MLNNAFAELVAFQKALKDLVASIDTTYAKQFEEFHVGFEGSFGNKHVSPRTLRARFLGNLVCVEGIVTKCEKDLLLFFIYFVLKIIIIAQVFKAYNFTILFRNVGPVFCVIYLGLSC